LSTIVHTNWLQLMLGAGNHTLPDFDTDDIEAALLDATDVPGGAVDGATDEDYADVSAGLIVAGAQADVPGGTASGGVVTLSGALTFSAITGDAADYLTVFKNSGTDSTSPLMITWDSASTGLPVTPNGGDITATWGSSILVTLA
jgi:hypothetical protein